MPRLSYSYPPQKKIRLRIILVLPSYFSMAYTHMYVFCPSLDYLVPNILTQLVADVSLVSFQCGSVQDIEVVLS